MDKPENENHDEHEFDLPPGIDLPDGKDIPDYPHWKAGWICSIALTVLVIIIASFIPVNPKIIERWKVILFAASAAFVIGFAFAAFRPGNLK
ncbi:MAG: hypothetical protein GY750_02150 [Lentisphaerae bacterium]|nr:hypothetical protein [Lentisphaerota bacterium]MCP4100222.1 hypothetical protein [Lentisphaerota bacterium]